MKFTKSLLCLMATLPIFSHAETIYPVEAVAVGSQPVIDGNFDEWDSGSFHSIPLMAAIDDDPENTTGNMTVELASAVSGDTIFFAVKWADETESLEYRPWQWRGTRYRRGQERDDMLALRFDLGGDFDRSMIAESDYQVDVWVWSSARSNPVGLAEDNIHVISTTFIENAAEYELDNGKIIYIDRSGDEGEAIFSTVRPPRQMTESSLSSIEWEQPATLSQADVKAKGIWKDGFWFVEFARKLNTGYSDDRQFDNNQPILMQIAVFNESSAENKSVSEPMHLIIGQ